MLQILKKICLIFILIKIFVLVWVVPAFADNPSDLDPTFNNTGVVTNTARIGFTVAVQANDKIVVGGSNQGKAVLARYNNNGTLDTDFNTTGMVTASIQNSSMGAITVNPNDGKIVGVIIKQSGTSYEYFLTRYTITGTLDTTFNNGGIVTLPVQSTLEVGSAIVLPADGNKIVVACKSALNPNDETVIVRVNNDGSFDTSFNGTGVLTNTLGLIAPEPSAIAIDADNKIVMAGSGSGYGFVVRYNDDGSLDDTFSDDGVVTSTIHRGDSVAIQPDGNIVSAGSTSSVITNRDFSIIRYDTHGNLDHTFNSTGIVTTPITNQWDSGNSVAIQSNGRIVLGGISWNNLLSNYDLTLIRYDNDGNLDSTFNNTGILTTSVSSSWVDNPSIALQSDGKILMVTNNYVDDSLLMMRYIGDPVVNLNLTKTVQLSISPIQPGDTLTYTIVIANDGEGNAAGVVITDSLPTYIEGTGLTQTVDITAGTSVTFTLNVTLSNNVPFGEIITNTAYFSHTSNNGQDSVIFSVGNTDFNEVYLPIIIKN